jgi:hypothetical protein
VDSSASVKGSFERAVFSSSRARSISRLASSARWIQADRALEELLLLQRVGLGRRRDGHHVAVERLVELAHAVAGHRRPVRVEAPHRFGVRVLRVEQALTALLQDLGEVRRHGHERDLLALLSSHLAEREAHGRELDRGRARVADAVLLDHVAREADLVRRLVELVLLDQAERLRAVGLDRFDHREVREREDLIGDADEIAPALEERVEARDAEERAARRRVLREALQQLVVARDRRLALAEPFVRERAVVEARRGDLTVG